MANEIFPVLVDGLRSPIGKKDGELIGILPDDLCSIVVKALLERNDFVSKEDIEDLVLGCAFPEGPQGMLLGRAVSLLAGIPKESCAKVVNRFCGSSMDSVHQICQAIISGDIETGIAAGVEDMFAVPMGGFAPSFNPTLYEQEFYIGMGETAENLANDLNISREDQDLFAISSHKKALNAWEDGRFDLCLNWRDGHRHSELKVGFNVSSGPWRCGFFLSCRFSHTLCCGFHLHSNFQMNLSETQFSKHQTKFVKVKNKIHF